MSRYFKLSVLAIVILAVLKQNIVSAKDSYDDFNGAVSINEQEVSYYVSDKTRSLEQIADLSGISLKNLKKLNKGYYDNIEIIKKGDSIIVPSSSFLLTSKENNQQKNNFVLPDLGTDESEDNDVIEIYVAEALKYIAQQDVDKLNAQKLKEDIEKRTITNTKSLAKKELNEKLITPIKNTAQVLSQSLLGYLGTAQLQFEITNDAKINNVNFKLFSPWYDSSNSLLFSQISYQTYDENRKIGNIGIGQRWDVDQNNWLLGYNVFFDHDFTRNHNRIGLGLEAWSDYLKFAANYYNPLSDWKDDIDVSTREERAAKGFDVRLQQYLPFYPHLGASLMYEKYFGNQVALFGKDKLLRDPHALTVGINYTPVPIFTVKAEHKQGTDSSHQSKLELGLNYRIGVPLKDQLDPNLVQASKTLKGSRYDLVDRNNYIVLEYRDKKFSIDLASLGEKDEGEIAQIVLNISNSKTNEYEVKWNNVLFPFLRKELRDSDNELKKLYENNGCILYNGLTCTTVQQPGMLGSENWKILVPDYINTAGEIKDKYSFYITMKTSEGVESVSNTSILNIKPSKERRMSIIKNNSNYGTASKPLLADGNSSLTLTAMLYDDKTKKYFNDEHLYSSYPTSKLDVDVDKLNEFWSATVNSDPIKFVYNESDCESNNKCLIVEEISKNKIIQDEKAIDAYKLTLKTKSNLDQVKIKANLLPYGSKESLLYFVDDKVSKLYSIKIFNESESIIATGIISNNQFIDINDPEILKIGKKFIAKPYIYDSEINNVVLATGVKLAWSLVGDNSLANCPSTTYLPDNEEGPWYHVAVGEEYTFKDNSGMLSQGLPGLVVSESDWGQSVHVRSKACAGDQGFKLRLTAFQY